MMHYQIPDPGHSHHELRTPKADEAEGKNNDKLPDFDPGRSHPEPRTPKADEAEGNNNDLLQHFVRIVCYDAQGR